jgi:hypothetical protein
MTDEQSERRTLTFEQAERLEPPPSQLQLREISDQLRAVLWNRIHKHLNDATEQSHYSKPGLGKIWRTILKDEHVHRRHKLADDFENNAANLIKQVRSVFETGTYANIFGWLEFVLKHPACPPQLAEQIENCLRYCRAAYRVIGRQVICPISSEAESEAIKKSLADLSGSQFNGARSHLLSAASHLTAGNFTDSVRESIRSVEAVASVIEPSANELSKALQKLEEKTVIHPAMTNGFDALYAYTSDESGIRHALLEASANVDETDALFMLGSSASFVSYLVGKARLAGLLEIVPLSAEPGSISMRSHRPKAR